MQWVKKERTGLLHRHPFERKSSQSKPKEGKVEVRDLRGILVRSSLAQSQAVGRSIYYRKRGSASYIVREVHSVRERERERERERYREKDGSDVTIVALKLAMSFALFLAKMCTLVLATSFALFLAKKFKVAPQFLPS